MFFPPAAMPVMPLYPDQMTEWLEVFGRGNAAAFDAFGWSYYTRDRFDLHYPGYWDTYPALHGATGMTYETDGGGSRLFLGGDRRVPGDQAMGILRMGQ